MTTEQGGAPSASAGGAPAPDAVGTIRRVGERSFVLCDSPNGNRLWVQVVGGGHIVDGEFWRVDTRPVVGAVPGTPAARDPRDAEIERLRGQVYSNNVAMGGFVTRIATALGGKSFGDARELVDDVQRLVRDCADNAAEWKRADAEVTRLRGQVDELAGIRVALFDEVRSALAERDEARKELDSRLGETALRDLVNRLHAIVDAEDCVRESVDEDHVVELITNVDNMLERAGADAARAIQKCLEVEAERDRLRKELDLIHEQHAAGLIALRTDFAAAVNGLLPKLAEPNRQGCPCKSQCDYLDGEDRCSDSCDCAAGRRWVAGDPEPEIGTLITWGSAGSAWERHGNGWKTAVCQCKKCSSTIGLTWPDLLAYAPLVEVVTSDG